MRSFKAAGRPGAAAACVRPWQQHERALDAHMLRLINLDNNNAIV